MIEFMKHSTHANEKNRSGKGRRVRVIGLGQTGIAAIDQLVLRRGGVADVWAMDTDAQTLEASVAPEKYLAGTAVTHGLGCGGDAALGHEVVEADAERLKEHIAGAEFLILTTGLGGGTGAVLAQQLATLAREAEVPTLAVVCLPFHFESRQRLQRAIEAVEALRATADGVLVFANDRLSAASSPGANLRKSFHHLDRTMAATVESLALALQGSGLIQMSFSDVRSIFGRFTGIEALENAWCGTAEASAAESQDGAVDLKALVTEALAHPLLSGAGVWSQGDQVLACVQGGSELSLSEVQELVRELEVQLPIKLPLSVSATMRPKADGKLRLTLLVANTTHTGELPEAFARAAAAVGSSSKKPEPAFSDSLLGLNYADAPAPASLVEAGSISVEQEELPLAPESRGRFERSAETIYKGQDLDIPTFRRWRIPVQA